MIEESENLLSVAIEIRELLKLVAEPAIAQRDEKLRGIIKQIVGKSLAKQKATFLMDGSRNQKDIIQETKIDSSDLSKLVKSFRSDGVLLEGEKPKLKIPLPAKFFEI
jgi:hypothetical protein